MLSYKKIGTGYPLVLIHGYLGGQAMWKFQEDLKNDYDLIMPSLAGYGESSHMTAPSTINYHDFWWNPGSQVDSFRFERCT